MDFPKIIATKEELGIARKYGKPIEGRDGDFIVKGYVLGDKIYLYAFDEMPQTNA